MKLYGSLTSPFVRKVRVFAIERGVSVELVTEDPWRKTERLLSLTPLGKIPVLVCSDGGVVLDSLGIVEFLDEVGDPGERMLPDAGPSRRDAMNWHALAHGVIDAVVSRLLETRRPTEFQMSERMKREEERIASVLAYVESHLDQLPGADPQRSSFAEIMIGVAMRYTDFRYSCDWRASQPRLAQLVDRLATRASFIETEPP